MISINPAVARLTDWRAEMQDRLGQLQASAPDLILTGGGEWSTDIAMPSHLVEAAERAVRGRPQYTTSAGIRELRAAISDKLKAENGITCDPDEEIVVTASATEAVNVTLRTLLSPGDEVIVGDPYYLALYRANFDLAGADPVFVPCAAEQNFHLPTSTLRDYVTERTKAIVITSPENPTGAVLSRSELEQVAEVALERGLWVIADDMYERFVYDGHQHVSFASLPGIAAQTVTINGFSKTYGLTGYRVGYVAGPADTVRQIAKVHATTTLCASEVSQRVALAALQGPQDWIDPIVERYSRARLEMARGFNALDGVSCPIPDGAIYVFPDFASYGMTSMQMAEHLIRSARVANRPGRYFGDRAEGRVRFNIPPDVEVASEVVRRVKAALEALEH
jgi:aspartate/methionine/tyrosine aminotransferase